MSSFGGKDVCIFTDLLIFTYFCTNMLLKEEMVSIDTHFIKFSLEE